MLTGLIPQQIPALGITISASEEKWFFGFLAATLVYGLATFIIYAYSDYLISKHITDRSAFLFGNDVDLEDYVDFAYSSMVVRKEGTKDIVSDVRDMYGKSRRAHNVKRIVEFALPICYGIGALILVSDSLIRRLTG